MTIAPPSLSAGWEPAESRKPYHAAKALAASASASIATSRWLASESIAEGRAMPARILRP